MGVFLKRQRKFAELRPKQRWLTVTVRKGEEWEAFRLTGPADLDDAFRRRLTEAFGDAG